MDKVFNIYCDESCHLEFHNYNSMVLGCVMVNHADVKRISNSIKDIKSKHSVYRMNEIKSIKVSENKLDMYLEIVKLFVDEQCLKFRCVIIPDKSILDHSFYTQTQNEFYYKMFYYVLRELINCDDKYNVYFDLMDKYQNEKVQTLKTYLCNHLGIEEGCIRYQLIRSYESQLMQLTDILIGAVSYKTRIGINDTAKARLIIELESSLGIDISQTTSHNDKFNVLRWKHR